MNDDESLHKHIQLDGPEGTEWPIPTITTGGGGGSGGGEGPTQSPLPSRPGPIKQFYLDLKMVLTEPTLFFKERFPEITFTYALTFGILVAWIASFLEWLTRIIRHETLFDSFLKMRDSLQSLPMWKNLPDNFWAQSAPETQVMSMPPWLLELFGILLSPFQTLLKVVTYGLVIFIGSYLLVPRNTDHGRDPVELKGVIKIVAISAAPVLIAALLGFLPLGLAGFIAWIYSFVILVVGLSTRFQVSGLRGIGIVLLPGIVGFIFLGCVVGAIGAVFFGLFTALFGGMH